MRGGRWMGRRGGGKNPKTAKIVGGDTQGEGEAEKKGTLLLLLLLLLRTRASRGGELSLRIREFIFSPARLRTARHICHGKRGYSGGGKAAGGKTGRNRRGKFCVTPEPRNTAR